LGHGGRRRRQSGRRGDEEHPESHTAPNLVASPRNRTPALHTRLIFARLAPLAVAALVAGCGGASAAPRPCPAAISGEPERRPPSGVALPAGARLYLSEGPFGKTERFYASLAGTEDELEAARDRAADALVGAGYRLLRKDAEPPVEAEAHVDGPHMVSVQVTPFCDGRLRLRYTVS
jgi:hypothetical protein